MTRLSSSRMSKLPRTRRVGGRPRRSLYTGEMSGFVRLATCPAYACMKNSPSSSRPAGVFPLMS
jgi:hypothetical protein